MTGLLLGSFFAGWVGSPHCVGMCGGFATATATDARSATAWHAGKLSTYAALGAIAGVGGASIPGPAWVAPVLAGAMLVFFAARLAGLGPAWHVRLPGLTRLGARLLGRGGVGGRFLFGMINGLLPCGLVWAALGAPVALASPLWGAAAMVSFGLGTAPALVLASVGLNRLSVAGPWSRRAVAAGVLVAGLYAIGTRSAAGLAAPEGEPPACHEQ